MAERFTNPGRPNHGLRWAAGFALAAVGATALYDRARRTSGSGGAAAKADPQAEFSTGRGTPQAPVDRASRRAGYELADTNVRLLVIVMVVSITIMIAGLAGVFFMFASFDKHFLGQATAETPEQRAEIVPPLPHLQAEPYREIDATLMQQVQRLTTYGWNDAGHTSAHIPIERAMRQVVGKSLDASATADAAGPAGTSEAMPSLPAFNAAIPQDKPANRVQGEGRPGAVAPSYDPAKDAAKTGEGK